MSDETTLRDTFAAAALTGALAGQVMRVGGRVEQCAGIAYELADAMLRVREQNGAPDAREKVTDHDAAPAAKAAEPARSPGRSQRGTGDTTREPVDVPATWQDECCAVEAAFARSNVRPTWPDDEPGNIGPMAAAMADEITRLRAEVARLRLTDAEREALKQAIEAANGIRPAGRWTITTLRALLARLGGDK